MGILDEEKKELEGYAKDLQVKILKKKIELLKMQVYQQNPEKWYEERFKGDPRDFAWSKHTEYSNHKWDGDVDPLMFAWENVASNNWVAVASGSGTSKTYWLSRLCFWFLDTFENSLVVTSAPKLDQVKYHIWAELTRAINQFRLIRPDAFLTTTSLKVNNKNGNAVESGWQAIGFVSGAGIEEESASKAQGFHRKNMLIILDETPGMSYKVLTAFENTCTGKNNIIVAVGNPDSEFDSLALFSKHPRVKMIRCSAYDHPNIVIGKEFIGGAVTNLSIETRKTKYGEDSEFFKSRVRGIIPTQGEDALIRKEWIEQCVNAEIDVDYESENACGVDVANSLGGDKACVVYGERNTVVSLHEFNCSNASHLAFNLIYTPTERRRLGIIDYQIPNLIDRGVVAYNVGIDSVGVGLSTLQTMENMGYNVKALIGGQDKSAIPKDPQTDKPLYLFASLRAQMYWQLREDLRSRIISIRLPNQLVVMELVKRLTSVRYETKGGTIYVEKKEDLKRRLEGKSPNDIDALCYWNWVRKSRDESSGGCFW